jgi:hypothetical protein
VWSTSQLLGVYTNTVYWARTGLGIKTRAKSKGLGKGCVKTEEPGWRVCTNGDVGLGELMIPRVLVNIYAFFKNFPMGNQLFD